MMKTRLILGAAVVAAAIPAVIGLWGNASFSQDLPVRVPASGQVVPLTPSPTLSVPSPALSPSEAVDDHGGDTPRDQRTEPGDDHGGSTSGTDDSSGHDAGDDHGGSGHGSDD